MNRFIYSLILYLATPIILLYLSYRALKSRDYRGRIGERFGLKKLRPSKPVILVHSVSVGETIAATPLINALIKQYPEHHILVKPAPQRAATPLRKTLSIAFFTHTCHWTCLAPSIVF